MEKGRIKDKRAVCVYSDCSLKSETDVVILYLDSPFILFHLFSTVRTLRPWSVFVCFSAFVTMQSAAGCVCYGLMVGYDACV